MRKQNNDDHTPNYGAIIKHLRKDKGITIVQLAKEMGVSQAYISRLEQGQIKPTKEQLEVLSSFIDAAKPPDIWGAW